MASVVIAMLDAAAVRETPDLRVRAVVATHHDFIWRLLRRVGVAEDLADDAAQQVFCVFAARLSDVAPDKEKTFLFGVALRVAQKARRARARRSEVSDEEAIAAALAVEASPDEIVDARRARAVLDAMLEALPIDLRTVFVLHEIEEMTMAEIAIVLDLPPGTVASRLRRARASWDELSRRFQEQSR